MRSERNVVELRQYGVYWGQSLGVVAAAAGGGGGGGDNDEDKDDDGDCSDARRHRRSACRQIHDYSNYHLHPWRHGRYLPTNLQNTPLVHFEPNLTSDRLPLNQWHSYKDQEEPAPATSRLQRSMRHQKFTYNKKLSYRTGTARRAMSVSAQANENEHLKRLAIDEWPRRSLKVIEIAAMR